MKAAWLIVLPVLFPVSALFAQNTSSKQGRQHAVSVGVQVPVGLFSESHFAGIGTGYLWSNRRFGKTETLPRKLIGFTASVGFDYYFGKNVSVAGYDFSYSGYGYLYAFGGIIYHPFKNSNIRLTAGPAAGLYAQNLETGWGIKLDGSYYAGSRIAVSPGIMYMKQALTSTLWAIMIKAVYDL